MNDHDWADWTPEDAYREGREESAEEIERLQSDNKALREVVINADALIMKWRSTDAVQFTADGERPLNQREIFHLCATQLYNELYPKPEGA